MYRRNSISSFLLIFFQIVILGIYRADGELGDRVKRVVGGGWAPSPPEDDPIVFVTKDDREARIFGTKDPVNGYYLFRGLRYAEPPIGDRRFQRPFFRYLEDDVNATQWGSPCPQPDETGAMVGSEDCLFLNVFTPALPDATEGYPVLVWIHGGGFRRGAATQYEMRNLVDKKAIVVSIQYRLGSLGFLSNNDKDLPGNNGLFDMMAAVQWITDYIEFFGGNPNKITAFGQGTGASSAFLLGLSDFGNEAFSGIIAMSGSALSNFAIDKEPKKSSQSLATSYRCPTNNTVLMVRCLRQLDAASIVNYDTQYEVTNMQAKSFVTDLSSLLGNGPVIEGKNDDRSLPNFVLDKPENTFNMSEKIPAIPLLTGVVKDETGGAVNGPFKSTISQALAVPDFLMKQLIPNLQQIVPAIGGISQQFVPEAFGKYLNLPLDFIGIGERKPKSGPVDIIAKATEVLNDAIFNVPAFLTAQTWGKKAKAYMYSFDHKSKHGFGKDFLSGLPLVGNTAQTGLTSHGDDLGYLFEPNDISGRPMSAKQNFDVEDQLVKESFTELVVRFARYGHLDGDKKSEQSSFLPFNAPSFSQDGSFLSISSKPQVAKNFKFCEMGLWAGIGERIKSSACSLFQVDLKDPLKTIDKTLNSFGQIPGQFPIQPPIPSIPSAIPSIPSPVNIPGQNLFPTQNAPSSSILSPSRLVPTRQQTNQNSRPQGGFYPGRPSNPISSFLGR
ncbi:hypothetical protein QAD02_004352 [Eretmocerus hayati]|uniref:Uncharacterized protein n=1 Tax=Eretmocerus hayati TaxID=131215 RepID=A0ACC2NR42_9HYME|nr:hypothetical protein QAD02_004352 [Eretmocerus hayati]